MFDSKSIFASGLADGRFRLIDVSTPMDVSGSYQIWLIRGVQFIEVSCSEPMDVSG